MRKNLSYENRERAEFQTEKGPILKISTPACAGLSSVGNLILLLLVN